MGSCQQYLYRDRHFLQSCTYPVLLEVIRRCGHSRVSRPTNPLKGKFDQHQASARCQHSTAAALTAVQLHALVDRSILPTPSRDAVMLQRVRRVTVGFKLRAQLVKLSESVSVIGPGLIEQLQFLHLIFSSRTPTIIADDPTLVGVIS